MKTMIPNVFEDMFDGPQNLPYWLQKNQTGYIVYLTIISVSDSLIISLVLNNIPYFNTPRAWLTRAYFNVGCHCKHFIDTSDCARAFYKPPSGDKHQ